MKTLMQELDNVLTEKNSRIALLEWELETVRKENEDLKQEIKRLESRRPFSEVMTNED